MIVPVSPFLLQDRIGIPQSQVQSYVYALLAAYAGASVVSSIPAGWIADRTSTPFLAGLTAPLAAKILLAFEQSIAVLVLARVLQGISATVVWTVGLAMVLDTVGPENPGKVVGSIFSFISVGDLLAPVLGGILYNKTGYADVFGVGAATLGVDFIMQLLVLEKKIAAKYDNSSVDGASNTADHGSRGNNDDTHDENDEEHEETALLPKSEVDNCKMPDKLPPVVCSLPILYCLKNPRLLEVYFSHSCKQAY